MWVTLVFIVSNQLVLNWYRVIWSLMKLRWYVCEMLIVCLLHLVDLPVDCFYYLFAALKSWCDNNHLWICIDWCNMYTWYVGMYIIMILLFLAYVKVTAVKSWTISQFVWHIHQQMFISVQLHYWLSDSNGHLVSWKVCSSYHRGYLLEKRSCFLTV